MSKETTNQGYIDALAYASDPDNVDTPDQQHNEYERGIKSYGLSQDGDSAALNSLLTPDTINSRVGVNTSSPAVSLDVTGDIRSSTGILFGTDTAAANLLDDYEEGTWTPVITGSTGPGSKTYTTQAGNYTKIGNLVVIEFSLVGTFSVAPSGDAVITGLPFSSSSSGATRSNTCDVGWSIVGSFIELGGGTSQLSIKSARGIGGASSTSVFGADISDASFSLNACLQYRV